MTNCECVIINDVIRGKQSISFCEIHSEARVKHLIDALYLTAPLAKKYVEEHPDEKNQRDVDSVFRLLAPL